MAKTVGKKKKSAKQARTTVHIGKHRLEKIAKAADKADVGDDLQKVLGKTTETVFVKMGHSKFKKLKTFIAQHPTLAKHLDDCDCDENDPFCVCT